MQHILQEITSSELPDIALNPCIDVFVPARAMY